MSEASESTESRIPMLSETKLISSGNREDDDAGAGESDLPPGLRSPTSGHAVPRDPEQYSFNPDGSKEQIAGQLLSRGGSPDIVPGDRTVWKLKNPITDIEPRPRSGLHVLLQSNERIHRKTIKNRRTLRQNVNAAGRHRTYNGATHV